MLATLAAVLTGLTALAPPAPPTVAVVSAAHLLPAGSALAADDLDEVALPADAVPDGAWTDPAALIGERLAGPVPARQVLTPSALLRHRSSGYGTVVAPLAVADDRVARLLTTGDQVDVLAVEPESGKTRVVASAVRVVARASTDADGGLVGVGAGGGALVLVEVSADTAAALAGAGARAALSVVWR